MSGEVGSPRTVLTVAEVLRLPAVLVGRPEVLAARAHVDNPVRWVHVSELPDIAGLLQGGELILTTGVFLPVDDVELRRYAAELAGAGASGLIVELGRRFTTLPPALVRACERTGLPLVALHREVQFVKITESVHSMIVEHQFAALRASEQAHEVFTALCVEGGSPDQIISEVARMAGCPVVFENLMHQVIGYDTGGMPVEDLLRNWEARSRVVRADARTGVCGPEGWVVTSVEARGEAWGRLVLLPADDPSPTQVLVLERGATALTLNRLLERNRETLERHAHRSILSDIVDARYSSAQEVEVRSKALGVPIGRRALVAVVVDAGHDTNATSAGREAGDPAELVAAAARAADVRALVGVLPGPRLGALVPLAAGTSRRSVIERLAREIHKRFGRDRLPAVVAVGSTVRELDEVRRSFAEAGQVADVARRSGVGKLYYELPDIQLRGLLYILSEDPRLQAFVERSLGPLLEHDSQHGTELLETLRVYVGHGGNKSEAALALHLSRQGMYQRLEAIGRILGVCLDSAEVRTSLHAAVMALDSSLHTFPAPEGADTPRTELFRNRR
ncbi:PucR family transcriptional regulator [Phytoactinopolyspora limicola]|uniref:PucR family transcriptional regulator n=1 Tax=Phytoactinopolyspora limicola TaxID=2715536 RepID=UPI001407903D|nr:PucR family transcriptional regulator ligand-binding domain-containing protein [Phytoactinopolyspora limicola]